MDREYANLLTRKTGSIMNKNILSEYNQAINQTVTNSKGMFKNIDTIDTGSHTQNEVNRMVTSQPSNRSDQSCRHPNRYPHAHRPRQRPTGRRREPTWNGCL